LDVPDASPMPPRLPVKYYLRNLNPVYLHSDMRNIDCNSLLAWTQNKVCAKAHGPTGGVWSVGFYALKALFLTIPKLD
jgi:hypothetical protein